MPPLNAIDTAWSITLYIATGAMKADEGIKMFVADTKEEVISKAKDFLSKKKVAYILQYDKAGEVMLNPVQCGTAMTPWGLVWSIPK